ncbi:hypothetical protein HO976_02215 [Streptococcus suis]|nr:hypothetical protein [Streptococcus suis]
MVKDVLPELLRGVRAEFEAEYGKSEVVRRAFETLKAKKATYATANDFAIEIGEILSEALGASVSADKLPDGKLYYNIAKRLLDDVLGRNHELVSEFASDVQKNLNEQANIGLKVQVPELNQDRIDGIVNRFSSEGNFDDVKWLLGEPVVNFTQSIVDDSIRVNTDFHAKAGMTPTISRQSTGHCCKWCDSLVGNYIYGEEPQNFYRRHQHCRCTIDYHPKNGKRQNSWSKKWTKESKDVLEQRKQMNIDIRDNNRKADIQEYKQIVEVLGYQNAPISLAKFQDLKYNDGEDYERLKTKSHIQNMFNSGKWLDEVNPDKQQRHLQSNAVEGKSFFYDDVDTSLLYNQYKQTSKFRKKKGVSEDNYELIDLPDDADLGIDTYTGNRINGFTIHYSKTGAHLIPTYHERRKV